MKYIIIGASAAGITAAKTLRKKDPNAHITVISKEREIHSRCMIHHYISFHRDEKSLSFIEEDFFEKNNIEWIKGIEVKDVDLVGKRVITDEERSYPYDRLLIATGSSYFIPPIKNLRQAGNVFGFRDLSDAKAIQNVLHQNKKVVVIGAGLVGLDITDALLKRGIQTTVIEMSKVILPLQLDAKSAGAYQRRFEEKGCHFILNTSVVEATVNAKGDITGVILNDGRTISCDLAIVAVGVRSNITAIQNTKIKIDKGIVVNQCMQTSEPDVYAAGDVTGLSGIWPNAMNQGRIAADNMVGEQAFYEDNYAIKNTINFYDLVTLSIGRVQENENDRVYIREDRNIYQKIIVNNNYVEGVIMQGDIDQTGIWQYLIKNKIDIREMEEFIFYISFADFYTVDESSGKYHWSV